jgi:isopenicillin-N N-acyltransferase-like protein
MTQLPIPLIDVSGKSYERGVSYGKQAADRIHKGVAQYQAQIAKQIDRAALKEVINEYLPTIVAFDETYVEEMRGIAAGSSLEFEDILLINARTEILKKAEQRAKAQTSKPAASSVEPDGCTGLIALPAATKDKRVIHAQNWDWLRDCIDTSVVLRIRRDDGPDILTFTEAGGLARSGLNAAGISITANYLACDRDYSQTGVPLALIRRKVLQSEHLALAMHAVYATPKSASNNMMVSHIGGIGIDFECAPNETFLVNPTDGLVVHANHWVSPVALAKIRDTYVQDSPDTLYRDLRVRSLLEPDLGSLTIEKVKQALLDSFETPWSVCRPPRLNLAGRTMATVVTIVMDPQMGRMDIAPLPALGATFTSYSPSENRKILAAAD